MTVKVRRGRAVLPCAHNPDGQCDFRLGEPVPDKVWAWDGNVEAPTLTPSVNCLGGCGWHGHVTNGECIPPKAGRNG